MNGWIVDKFRTTLPGVPSTKSIAIGTATIDFLLGDWMHPSHPLRFGRQPYINLIRDAIGVVAVIVATCCDCAGDDRFDPLSHTPFAKPHPSRVCVCRLCAPTVDKVPIFSPLYQRYYLISSLLESSWSDVSLFVVNSHHHYPTEYYKETRTILPVRSWLYHSCLFWCHKQHVCSLHACPPLYQRLDSPTPWWVGIYPSHLQRGRSTTMRMPIHQRFLLQKQQHQFVVAVSRLHQA